MSSCDAKLRVVTPRERDLVAQLAHGLSLAEAAKALGITPKTASVHLYNIMGTLDVHSRAELIARAKQEGLAK